MAASHDSMAPEPDRLLVAFYRRRHASMVFGLAISIALFVTLGAFVYIGSVQVHSIRAQLADATLQRESVVKELMAAKHGLNDLDIQKDIVAKTVAALNIQNADLAARSSALQREIKSQQTQYETLKQNIESLTIASGQGAQNSRTALGVAGSTIFQIRAISTPTGQKSSDGPLYKFSAFIDANSETLSDITKVTYFFDHPTFRNKTLVSSDRTNNFRVGYTGWGCLSNVKVTVFFRKGRTRQTSFDMCKSLDSDKKGQT